ncbi:MAG: ABC transporter permease [Vampirovibrionales bacterium]|nr:ABC transporter permease [Vampirovibrionales bacterium]
MQWLFKKLIASGLTLLAIMVLTFLLVRAIPGGPFDNPKLPADTLALLNARFGLNDPLWVQLGHYLQGVLHGDLGPSLANPGRSVGSIILPALTVSAGLGALGLLFGVAMGVLLALSHCLLPWASLRHAIDTLMTALLATPSFVGAGLLVLLFAVAWALLPPATLGRYTPGTLSLPEARFLVLPALSLAISPATISYFLMKSTLQSLQQAPFIKVKAALGLPEKNILLGHVLRNAWMPLMALLGPMAANILTGSVAIETIFALPGLGKYFISAVINRDYTLVMGVTLVYSVFLVGLNLASDLVQGWLDPRLRQT